MDLMRVFALAVTLLLVPPAALAQSATDASPAEIASDVHGIHQALNRLVVLLEEVQQQQHVELLLKRIELKERRLAPLERRLRSAEDQVAGHEDELKHIEVMLTETEQEIDNEIRAGKDDPDGESRQRLEGLKRAVEPMNARLDEARLRMRRAEDDLLDGREEIEILDETLMELLEPERQ